MSQTKHALFYKVAEGQSLAANFTSAPTVVQYLDNFSYQIKIETTDSIGSFAVEVSNDYTVGQPGTSTLDEGTWTELTLGGGTPVANAANDTIFIDFNQVPFKAIRLVYTSTTPGTGTCDIIIGAKRI